MWAGARGGEALEVSRLGGRGGWWAGLLFRDGPVVMARWTWRVGIFLVSAAPAVRIEFRQSPALRAGSEVADPALKSLTQP